MSKRAFLFLILFIIYSVLTIIINQSSFYNSLLNLKAMIRYIFLINIIFFCKPSERQALNFIRLVIALAFIQATIGYFQFLGGEAVRDMFKPRYLVEETDLTFTALMSGTDTFGTMAYTINYASYLLVGMVFFISFSKRLNIGLFTLYVGIAYFMIALYLSNSRSAFIAASMAIILYYSMIGRLTKLSYFRIVAITAVLLLLTYLFVEKGTTNVDFWYFLSPNFYDMLESQRLGMLRVFQAAFGDPRLLFGLSPDKSFVVDHIVHNYKLPPLLAETSVRYIEDVFWVALIFYYGLIGVALLLLFLIHIYKKLRELERSGIITDFQQNMISSCKILLFLLIPMNFLNQTLKVRHFSFYLWLIIGFSLSVQTRQRIGKDRNDNNITIHN